MPAKSLRRLWVTMTCALLALGGCSITVSPHTPAPVPERPMPSPTASWAPGPSAAAGSGTIPASPAILAENLHPGSSGWRMGGQGFQIATDIGAQVKGYASAPSVEAGQPITLFVSVRPTQPVRIDIYRLGWYGGRGGRLMLEERQVPAVTQPACPIDPATGLRACSWLPASVLTIPTTWVSGLYLAVLTNAEHFQNAIPFVVRDDASTAPLLYVQPVTTYQAYNTWPSHAGGRDLYAAVKVSFDRPYANSGVGRSFFQFEQPYVAWLERTGYDVTYATSVDLDQQGAALLLRHRAMVTAGHDEYWTAGMRDAAAAALDHGTSLALFAADDVYWQARLEPSSDGRPDRVLVCYRTAARDPVPSAALKTVRWRDPPVSQPEQGLLGSEYTDMVAGRAAWVVADASSWVYLGTGLLDGQLIPGLVYGESDRPAAPPTAGTVAVLSDSPYRTRSGGHDRSEALVYQAASGGWVFDAGTFGWSGAVNPFASPDPRVERMTRNILDRMLAGSPL